MAEISTNDKPLSIGPFSQGIRHGDRINAFVQGPVNPNSIKIASNRDDYDVITVVCAEFMSNLYPPRSAIETVPLQTDIEVVNSVAEA
ncbi:hypothetical protein [Saliphagus infecundisoli]|uniref:Uncharacterized protein n=1 Tax=Saliphagus infecundisoli TaxID=1849069 RepID=A0ABD5QAD7_9EURY|nr:hypothetical protein [Saliphagus infecundisoli]